MPNITVIGSQWGDEGKGKVVDFLTGEIDYVVRFQGGNNAGHTVIVGDTKYVLHVIPSGILHADKICCIGNGVVLDPQTFIEEMNTLEALGIKVTPERLKISPKTHLIMPYHRHIDKAREDSKGGAKLGTTVKGIGPCYEDKAARIGIRACDLAEPELLRRKIEDALREKNAIFSALYGVPTLSVENVFGELMSYAPRFVPFLEDVSSLIHNAHQDGKTVLFEGAQGVMLDLDHGTYPYVTSSNTIAPNAAVGSGVSIRGQNNRVVAVVKAYTTRVGAGPFPTELDGPSGIHLQQEGKEVGATTGRKRRCGWLDVALLQECKRLCAPTEIFLTKLDVLGGLEEINICVAYKFQGSVIQTLPQSSNGLAKVQPVYETLPGWTEDISSCTSLEQLPINAQNYIKRIEEIIGVKISVISVGPERNQTIVVK